MAFGNVRRVAALGMRVAHSPLTRKIVHAGKAAADVAGVVGVPGASLVGKGLGVAEQVLDKINQ